MNYEIQFNYIEKPIYIYSNMSISELLSFCYLRIELGDSSD